MRSRRLAHPALARLVAIAINAGRANAGSQRPVRIGWQWLPAVLLMLTLAGCAGQKVFGDANALFADGQVDAGLAKLEEAVKLEPGNSEYRIALIGRRLSIVNRHISAAESARREGRLSDAEKAYQQVLRYDPNHMMARQGLDAMVAERRHRAAVAEAEAQLQKGDAPSLALAMEKLRAVLTENPTQKEALNLKARVNEAQAKQQKPETKLASTYSKPITLEFRDAPLRSVFDLISKVSGLNFFFDKDIRPDLRATILARNTSVEDAVRLLLLTNQLEQKVLNENSVLIYPSTPAKLKDYQTLAVRSFFLTNADVKAVSNSIKLIVKTKDLVVDERLGLIIMRDTPEASRVAERIVALQDVSDPEVMLEVEILEIKRSRLLELGVRWPASLGLSALPSTGTILTLNDLRNLSTVTTQATVGSASINANQQEQTANTLANPRIRVRNKEKAKVLIGDRVPVISTTSTSTGFVSESVNYVDVGLKLEVEPTVYLDEEVAIKINLEVSTLGAQTVSKAGTVSYQIGTRGANTVLRLRDGETQILAGLINDEDRASANKVPGMGELPMVGRLFGSQADDKQRSEILLSITPRVLRSIRRPEMLLAEFDSGTEASVGATPLRVTTVEGAPASVVPVPSNSPSAAQGVVPPRPGPTSPAATPQMPSGLPVSGPLATAAAPSPSAAATATATIGPPMSLDWQAPAQVRVGEQFSVVLRASSQSPVRGLPMLIGFDPQVLQVASVVEGEFFKQGAGRSTFNHRVDAAQGKVFIAAVRQSNAGGDPGINGTGSVATLTFKALRAGAPTKLQLLSATPEPASLAPTALPVEATIRITP